MTFEPECSKLLHLLIGTARLVRGYIVYRYLLLFRRPMYAHYACIHEIQQVCNSQAGIKCLSMFTPIHMVEICSSLE